MKQCRECKWYTFTGGGDYSRGDVPIHICVHPDIDYDCYWVSTADARKGRCGPIGLLWEEKAVRT